MKMDLKELLKKKLSEKELNAMQRSFDVIGSIAVIEIPSELRKKEKIIADALMNAHKNIKTVLKKSGKIKGRLRTRNLVWIAGEKTKETIHRENSCIMKLNVETCYFSPRMANDRLEVARKVRKGENVLVMFGGIAPYALVIAKNAKPKKVVSVEINKTASKYALENVRLNKLNNVEIIQGDVKKVLPKLRKKGIKFDRIMMARAQLKEDFLKEALQVAKKGTIIHLHDFLFEEDIPDAALDRIRKSVKKFRLIGWKRAGDIGPRKYRIRVDFMLL